MRTNLHNFPFRRQCYFNDERYLRYFRSYSQSNCQVECLTNYTINKCGCAKFWMPSRCTWPLVGSAGLSAHLFFLLPFVSEPPEVPVCGVEDINCYDAAQSDLRILIQNQTMQATMDPNMKIICDCMPACTSLDYNVEISSARYELAKTLQAYREVYEHTECVPLTGIIIFWNGKFLTHIRLLAVSWAHAYRFTSRNINLRPSSALCSLVLPRSLPIGAVFWVYSWAFPV